MERFLIRFKIGYSFPSEIENRIVGIEESHQDNNNDKSKENKEEFLRIDRIERTEESDRDNK